MGTTLLDGYIRKDLKIPVSRLEHNGFGASFSPRTMGNVWYVDSTHAAAANKTKWGDNTDRPFDKIATAVADANVLQGDIIIVRKAHVESVSAADAWKWANAGVYVLGEGWPGNRPVITFDTATTATILMDKQGCVIDNLTFVCGINALALMIQMTAAYNAIVDCLFILDDSSKNALIGIDLGNVAADRCKILGCEFESLTVGGDSAVKIATAVNDFEIAGCKVFGDFADACIHNPTGNVATNLNIHENDLTNTQTGDHAIELVSACTGVIRHNRVNSTLAAVATKTAIDPGACYCIENYGSDGVGDVSGVLNPTADA